MGLMEAIKVDNNYAVVIDDWYTEEEYNKAFRECKFMIDYGRDPKDTSAAFDIDGNYLKDNKAIFISDLFKEFNISTIGRYSDLKMPLVVEDLKNIDHFYHYLNLSNHHNCLVSYYEDSGHYKPHKDKALITMVTWLYEEPKAFKGGNLILRDKDDNAVKEIECIPNRSVIFPSYMTHEVTPIAMEEKDTGSYNSYKGRFTISQFIALALTA
jgi:hypothetical protein